MNDHEHEHSFDQGLQHDLRVLDVQANRRKVLGWLAAAGLTPILACGASEVGSDGSSAGASGSGAAGADTSGAGAPAAAGGSSAGAGGTDVASCSKIPEETGGPYPGDGSNGPNALTASGIVRDDITTSFGTLSGTAEGVPLTVTLKIVSASGCANLSGYAVYIWHCDRDGNYSIYTAANENYLRGVQETAADGTVTFKTIFPACYSGRWPHIHFEVYESLEVATAAGAKLATSQLALPKAQCDEVFATTGYEKSVANLAQVSLSTDMVFSDGADSETPTMTGSVASGYSATLTVGV
ncbi:MAG: intradiol ring-cleavage dioxygenase [Myxococcales bacterium]